MKLAPLGIFQWWDLLIFNVGENEDTGADTVDIFIAPATHMQYR